jgi:hypothetical protein
MAARRVLAGGLAFAALLLFAACEFLFPVTASDADAGSADGGGGGLDGATDAAVISVPDSADAAPLFCTTVDAAFCWDFDIPDQELPDLPSRLHTQFSTATFQINKTTPKSPPKALDLLLTTGVDAAGFSGLYHDQSPVSSHVRCMFHARIVVASTSDMLLASLHGPAELPQSPAAYILASAPSTTGGDIPFHLITTVGGQINDAPIGTLPQATWLQVALEVDADGLLALGTVQGLSAKLDLLPDAGTTLTGMAVGLAPAGRPTPWRVSYDNIYCDVGFRAF